MPDEIIEKIEDGLGLHIERQIEHDGDPNNYQLDQLGSWFGYTPKSQRKVITMLTTKNQGQVASCVCQSVAGQKEQDEGVELSAGYLGASLTQKGMMGQGGTSIRDAIEFTISDGIAEESVVPTHNTNFAEFSSKLQLTQIAKDNAATHKSKSYWVTNSLDTILQQIDNGERVGVPGMFWYPDYNHPGANPLTPHDAKSNSGHAVQIIGYDLNYNGNKVLIFHNSFGSDWGDHGLFYVKFEDFNKVIQFQTYYVLDIEKNLASWLSLNAHKAILDTHSAPRNGGQPVFVIEGNFKRWIPNEALMDIMGILPQDLLHDADNMLAQIVEGEQISLLDIPPILLDEYKRKIQLLNNPRTIAQLHQTFPSIF